MISVAIVTNCTAWLTQITALALPLLSAASSCLFNKQSGWWKKEKERKGAARKRGRDWCQARRMGALRPWSNVYPLNHSKCHLLPSAPRSALREKHYLSAGAIIHRWLPPFSAVCHHAFPTHAFLYACLFVSFSFTACIGTAVWGKKRNSAEKERNVGL